MKVSLFTTVTVKVTDPVLRLTGLPDKFIGCFTGPPTREKLLEAIQYKAEIQGVPETALSNILTVVRQLPGSELERQTATESGTVTVFSMEPLFKP